jgi:hypothetical protein
MLGLQILIFLNHDLLSLVKNRLPIEAFFEHLGFARKELYAGGASCANLF